MIATSVLAGDVFHEQQQLIIVVNLMMIRTCVPNLGAVRRERFVTIDNPLNPPGVGWVKNVLR